MKGIPVEQRGLRTIAKIGGLVGKTLIIDESTRFNRDYVRMKIACRNIDLVPPSAECSLGLFLYDFFFERETPTDDSHDKLQTQVDVGDEGQPSPKKPRTTPPLAALVTLAAAILYPRMKITGMGVATSVGKPILLEAHHSN